MSLLNSKFDITSVESPLAVAALAQVLEVAVGPASGLYTGADVPNNFMGGTPLPGANLLVPGTIVMMDAAGKAVKAEAPLLFVEGAAGNGKEIDAVLDPVMPFVTIDGNTDYSGSFVRKLTVFQGGFTMQTDQLDATAGTFDIGKPVTFSAGKVVPRKGAHAGKQIYGFVGPAGHDTVSQTLQVIVPQGASY
jgi:hypothetical protein